MIQQNEPRLSLVTRSMWTLKYYNFYNDILFNHFCTHIVKSKNKKITHQDVANGLESLSHFNHLDGPSMTLLIEKTIDQMNMFSNQSLAIVCNSLATLGVQTKALLVDVKERLLNESPNNLKPVDISQFLTAYCRAGFFDEQVIYMLEQIFLNKMRAGPVDQETLITVYCAHQEWTKYFFEAEELILQS